MKPVPEFLRRTTPEGQRFARPSLGARRGLATNRPQRFGVDQFVLHEQVAERFDERAIFLEDRGGAVSSFAEDLADASVKCFELPRRIVATAVIGAAGVKLTDTD